MQYQVKHTDVSHAVLNLYCVKMTSLLKGRCEPVFFTNRLITM